MHKKQARAARCRSRRRRRHRRQATPACRRASAASPPKARRASRDRRRRRRRRRPASTSAATAASASAPTGAATKATRPTSSRTARASKRRPISSSTSTTRAPSAATRTSAGAWCWCPRSPAATCSTTRATSPRTSRSATPTPRRENLGLDGLRAVGRLAHVSRRRHLPVRLLAARQPQHRRRRRVATSARSSTSRCRRASTGSTISISTRRSTRRRAGSGRRASRRCSIARASSARSSCTQRFGELPRRQGRALRRAAPSARRASTPIRPTMLKTALPSDVGWVVGAQLGGWLRPYVFANLWFRAAGGLAAYGELTVPTGLDPTRGVQRRARGRRRALAQLGVALARHHGRRLRAPLHRRVDRRRSIRRATPKASSRCARTSTGTNIFTPRSSSRIRRARPTASTSSPTAC